MFLINKIVMLSLGLSLAGVALAQDDAYKPNQADMLKPSQVSTEGESSNPANDSGAFLGTGVIFGQSRTTEEGVNPGVGSLLYFEPGYQVNRGSWNRLEFSGQFITGRASFGDNDVNVGLGLLAKFGTGYSLGDRVLGVLKFGVGPVMATLETEDSGEKLTSDGTLMGLGVMGGWQMVFPMSEALDLTGGLSYTHLQFDVGDLKGDNQKYKVNRQVIANTAAVDLGLRFRF